MIKNNPFNILEVSTRDNRQKIVEMAEDKSFELDEELCQKSQSDLITPSKRLHAEVDWFPGVSPARVSKIISTLNTANPEDIDSYGLPPLAKVNILLEILSDEKRSLTKEQLKKYIEELIENIDDIDVYAVLRDINEDREVAGFPTIEDHELIENSIENKKRFIVKKILHQLNNLDTMELVQTMTEIVEEETQGGEIQASQLIDDLVDDYKLHVHKFLEDESEKIMQAIDVIKEKASGGESVIKPLVDKLLDAVHKWDDIAQPIQLSAKARGVDERLSQNVAYALRDLAIVLYNDYSMLDLSKKISNVLLRLFSELPDIEVRVQEDISVLSDIERKKKNLAKQLLNELQVEGIDNLSSEQIVMEIKNGAKFKRFKYCHSFILVTYNKTSPVIFIKSSEGYLGHAMPYLLQSFFLGWWGFPWGPIYTIGDIFQNLFGGEDLTQDVVKILKDSGVQVEVQRVLNLSMLF